MELVTGFIFLDSKFTVDSDYSHEIKRCLLLGRKAVTNLDSVLKSRDTTLPTRICRGFSNSYMQEWELDYKEGWMPNNWCFCAVVLEKTLESSLVWKRSNQSILMEINPEYSVEGLMMRLKLQSFGHLMWRADLLEKTLMLGKIEGKRRLGWKRMRWLHSITDSVDMNLSKLRGQWVDRGAWCAAAHGVTKTKTRFGGWKTQQFC